LWFFLLFVNDTERNIAKSKSNTKSSNNEDNSVDGILSEEGKANTSNDKRNTNWNLVAFNELSNLATSHSWASRCRFILKFHHAFFFVEVLF
jgi:hypothetical protein